MSVPAPGRRIAGQEPLPAQVAVGTREMQFEAMLGSHIVALSTPAATLIDSSRFQRRRYPKHFKRI
jgi:hypothetical protein